MASDALYVCQGPACRLRARDLELTIGGARVPCVGRCDAPVAAFTVAGSQPRTLARELTLARRGHDPEPAAAPGAQRGPHEPIRLRDLLLDDHAELEMARRRGAYRGLEAPLDLALLLPGAWTPGARASLIVVDGGGRQPGQFALRPICERDPHALLAGMLIAARSAGAAKALLCLRQAWLEARRVLERALAEVRAAGLCGDVTLALLGSDEPVPTDALAHPDAMLIPGDVIAALPHIVTHEAGWWAQHATRLCAVSGDVARPGVYELDGPATVAAAISAAGGIVDGVRTSTLGSFLADGQPRAPTQADERAPAGLIVAHARRDPLQP